jgi:hypothetical protein
LPDEIEKRHLSQQMRGAESDSEIANEELVFASVEQIQNTNNAPIA